MHDLCEELEFIHVSPNILSHQNLRAGNVFLEKDKVDGFLRAKLCDFGMSCMRAFLTPYQSVNSPRTETHIFYRVVGGT
jgi:serine/threonine protein kinase